MLYPIIFPILKAFGVTYYLNVFEDALLRPINVGPRFSGEELFANLNKYFNEAKLIQFSLGEFGAVIMENPKVIEGIMYAHKKNKAKIQIVGGPRADPKTRTIFGLAKKGILEIYRTPIYMSNHFVIITGKNGEKLIVNESVHEETIWSPKTEDKIYSSITRAIYIFNRKKHYVEALSREFERRKSMSARITRHPGLNPPQNISSTKLLIRSFLWKGFILKHIIQPLSITVDLPLV